VIVVNGPRTVGKSTLLLELARRINHSVIDLDDPAVRDVVRADPGYLLEGPGPVLVDEFQHVPETLDAVKAHLNRDLRPGRFVLTGSTRYTTIPRAAQSLTGRVHILTVWPLSQGEIGGRTETFVERLIEDPATLVDRAPSTTTREDYVDRVTAGGMPLALSSPTEGARARWFRDYVDLVIERDVLDISRIRQRASLPRLLRQLAAQTAQVMRMSPAARAVGLEPSTAEKYAKLLEAVFLVHVLPAWGTTLGSRVGHLPKIHMVDSGLAASLLGITPDKYRARDPATMTEFGHLLETFAVGEVLKQVGWSEETITTGHFRTIAGDEVDLVLETADGRVVAIEVKAGTRVPGNDLGGLRKLRDKLGARFLGGMVLYLGQRAYTYEDRIHVIPVDQLWS